MATFKRYDNPGAHKTRARISAVDRLEYFLRSRASKVVVLALVANTMVAQLLYNSAGQLVIGNQVLLGYLLVSAICWSNTSTTGSTKPTRKGVFSASWKTTSRKCTKCAPVWLPEQSVP